MFGETVVVLEVAAMDVALDLHNEVERLCPYLVQLLGGFRPPEARI
jgi:hypothetical protein